MDELKIIKYLDGGMSGDELESFEEEIRLNPELAEELEKYREIQDMAYKLLSEQEEQGTGEAELADGALEEIDEAVSSFKKSPGSYGNVPKDYREQLMDAERELYRSSGSRSTSLVIQRIWYSAAAVAIILITISILIFKPFSRISPDEIYAEYFSPFRQTAPFMDIVRNDNDLLFAAEVYEAGDYERAAILFEMLSDSSGFRAWSLFYSGISYMSMNQTDRAIEQLKKCLDENDPDVIMHARWQLSLCYLKKGDKSLARTELEQLRRDPAYGKDAGRILKILE